MGRLTGILGLLTMLGLAYVFSTNRRAIRLKTVAWGLGLQFAFAVLVLRVDLGRRVFQKAGDAVSRLLSYSNVRRGTACRWRRSRDSRTPRTRGRAHARCHRWRERRPRPRLPRQSG